MDLLDMFDVPVVIEPTQLMLFVAAFFLFGLMALSAVILSKGYEMNVKYITYNLAGAMSAVVLFGAALGIFVIAMVMSPDFVSIPFAASEKTEMGITMFIVAFIVAITGVTFLVYTKRGGF